MRNRLFLLAVVAVLLGSLVAYWRSDRRRILARLEAAEEEMAKAGEEDQLTSFGKVRQVVELFAPGFLVVARPYEGTISDRQELAGVVHGYRSSLTRLALTHSGVRLAIDKRRGTAEMGVTLLARFDRGSGPAQQRFGFRIGWAKVDGEWLVHDCELLEVGDEEVAR